MILYVLYRWYVLFYISLIIACKDWCCDVWNLQHKDGSHNHPLFSESGVCLSLLVIDGVFCPSLFNPRTSSVYRGMLSGCMVVLQDTVECRATYLFHTQGTADVSHVSHTSGVDWRCSLWNIHEIYTLNRCMCLVHTHMLLLGYTTPDIWKSNWSLHQKHVVNHECQTEIFSTPNNVKALIYECLWWQ